MQERERQVIATLKQSGVTSLARKKVLEFGCGPGCWLREFVKWGAKPQDMTGVELLADRVIEAQQLCPPGVRIECRNGTKSLPSLVVALTWSFSLQFSLQS
jgi:Methyltransferase domain